jgi:hypothetical protein
LIRSSLAQSANFDRAEDVEAEEICGDTGEAEETDHEADD